MVESVLSTAVSLTKFILDWKSAREDSTQALVSLKRTVQSVALILDTVPKKDLPKELQHLESALEALTDTLNETKEILQSLQTRLTKVKAFLFPAMLTERVKRVEGDMLKFVQILSLGLSISPQIGRATRESDARGSSSASSSARNALDFFTSHSAREFWKKNFGEQAFSVKCVQLEKALKSDYSSNVDERMLGDLMMRLDNFNTKNVSVCRFAEFVGDNELRKQLDDYKFSVDRNSDTDERSLSRDFSKVEISGESGTIKYPLLLWIDDKVNPREIDYAKAKGISVILLKSTAEAKEWVQENPDITDQEDPSKLRVVTINVRQSANTSLEINAGEEIVRFLRGLRCQAPILVYCGDLKFAQYVEKYDGVSATNSSPGCRTFIDGLKS